MSNGLPCPNPTCAQVFAADAVKGAASLVCPRCGTVFQFRASTAPPAAAARPARPAAAKAPDRPAKPAAPPPPKAAAPPTVPSRQVPAGPPPLPAKAAAAVKVAAPVADVPVARPVGPSAPPKALAFTSGADVVVSPRHGRGRGRPRVGKIIALAVLALVCVGGAVGGIWFLRSFLGKDEEHAAEAGAANFRFRKPGPDWKPDRGIVDRLAVRLALSRAHPRSHAALHYRDYKKRSPSEGEMMDEALKRLRTYFKPLEYEDPFLPENKSKQDDKLGGQPAIVLEFAGADADEVEMRGQCYAMTYRGYAYWFFTWGPAEQREALAEGWQALRDGFQLLNGREGWKEQPRQTIPFDGTALPYRVDYPKEVWEAEANAKDYDDRCELLLRGFEPVVDEESGKKATVKFAGRAANVTVLVLPRAPDLKKANQAALDFLLAHKKEKEGQGGATIELAKDPRTEKVILDSDTDVGALRGHLSKLRIKHDEDTWRYALLGVVNRPEGVLVVFCDCPWDRRDFWEREFQLLMESVRSKSGSRPRGKGG